MDVSAGKKINRSIADSMRLDLVCPATHSRCLTQRRAGVCIGLEGQCRLGTEKAPHPETPVPTTDDLLHSVKTLSSPS